MSTLPRIHRAAVWDADIEAVCSFDQRRFAAEFGPLCENRCRGFALRFLALGDGARLKVMSNTALHL